MSGMDPREERPAGADVPWSADAGPEPAWADAIREGRKARGERLRKVFAAFDDDDDADQGRRPRRQGGRGGDGS